jgi:pseudomonalisin
MGSFSKRWGWAVLPPVLLLLGAASQTIARAAQPTDRIRGPVDDAVTVMLPGHVRPEVTAATAIGPAEAELPMDHMILTLKGDAAQEAALANLLREQQDPRSPNYHKFLTPQQFGRQFGASPRDVAKLTAWLTQHGFTVEQVPDSRRAIVFSGSAAAVTSTFGTTIHKLTVGGETHYANTEEPRIPAAFADVVGGFVKLNDFQHKTSIRQVREVGRDGASPQFTYGSSHYLAPADYATIYDLAPLYANGIDGTGQSIAIVGRSNISMSDLQTFRSEFGLPANNPTVIIASGTDPGFVSGDGDEATLDVQWSGAVAPKANIKLVVASSTATADGVDLSAQYIVNNNIAPVMSVSFGSCEPGMGSGGVAFYNALWQQAAAQGITVLISSGDSGAAGCSAGSATSGSMRAVNGLCTSPYDVCVGGTEFSEGSNPGQYWLPGNNSTMGSAQSYIPETVWNESASNGGSELWAGGGGASIYFTKPTWQAGPGVPADGARDVPDVALTAAGHDGYLIEEYGGLYSIAGTSAASPSFAGIMALVSQKAGTRLGVPNAALYGLASLQATGGTPVFHDVTTGSNTVPGVTGFAASAGYDRATGLGSVDGALLVNHWTDGAAVKPPTLTATNTPAALTVAAGAAASFTTAVAGGGSFKSAVTLTVSGAPSGVTVTLSSTSIASPGSGSITTSVAVAKTAAAGTYPITITASGGGLVAKATTALTITTPSFVVLPSTTAVNLSTGSSTSLPVSITPSSGFNSSVSLSVSGLPSGVTAAFSPATISGTAASASALTFIAGQTAKTGTFAVTLTATGGGLTKTATVNLVIAAPNFALTLAGAVPTLPVGGTAGITLGITPSGGFHSAISLSVSGLPSGVTASFSPATLSVTTAASSILTLKSASTTLGGTFTATVSASGAGLTKTLPLTITVPAASFSLSASSRSAVTVAAGGTATSQITFTPGSGFTAPVTLSASGLPSGITASFAPATLSGASAATPSVTFHVAAGTKVATATATITATGGGISRSISLPVTVQASSSSFTVGLSNQFITVKAGGPAVTVSMELTATGAGFNVPVTLMVTGTQANISQKLGASTLTVAAPSTPLTISAAANASPGIYTVWFAAYTNSQYQPIGLSVTVTR